MYFSKLKWEMLHTYTQNIQAILHLLSPHKSPNANGVASYKQSFSPKINTLSSTISNDLNQLNIYNKKIIYYVYID